MAITPISQTVPQRWRRTGHRYHFPSLNKYAVYTNLWARYCASRQCGQTVIHEERKTDGRFIFSKCFPVRWWYKTGYSQTVETWSKRWRKCRKSRPTSTKRRMLTALRREVCRRRKGSEQRRDTDHRRKCQMCSRQNYEHLEPEIWAGPERRSRRNESGCFFLQQQLRNSSGNN